MTILSWDYFETVCPKPYEKLYTLYFFRKTLGEFTEQDIKSTKKKMERLKAKKEFEHVAWFLAVSTTDSETCHKRKMDTKKAGRPKTIVEGKKEKLHIHMGMISKVKGKSANKFAEEMKKFILRRKKKTGGIWKAPLMGMCYVQYSHKQADHFYTSNDYNFKQYMDGYNECWEYPRPHRNGSKKFKFNKVGKLNRRRVKSF